MDPDPRLSTTDLLIRIRILLFSSVADKQPTKNMFFAYYFLKVHLHQSSKIKSQKKLQKEEIKVFLTFFACSWKDPDLDKIMTDTDP